MNGEWLPTAEFATMSSAIDEWEATWKPPRRTSHNQGEGCIEAVGSDSNAVRLNRNGVYKPPAASTATALSLVCSNIGGNLVHFAIY
jgi:hypothetical protein